MRKINPSGFVKYDNEDELKEQLEQYFFPIFFDDGWVPIDKETKEVRIADDSIIDYYGMKNNKECYVEVKNWFVTYKDLMQILRYNEYIGLSDFYVICGGIDKDRGKTLEQNNITVIITKDIDEISEKDIDEIPDNEVVYWM